MKVQVKVLKFTGETGLRQPGTLYFEDHAKAIKLDKLGLIQLTNPVSVELETKEEKHKPETKRGRKKKS